MLPIYNALILEQSAILGGTTLPCIMVVGDKDGNIKGNYVVKVFGQQHIKQYNPTNKEIFANVLAEEFDLIVPKGAIIYVNETLIAEIQKNPSYRNLELKSGYYFGCEYIESVLSFSNVALSNYEKWEVENIFAFDVLIRNFDRRIGKPNILATEDNFILIDHDLSLDIQKSFIEYIEFDNYQNLINGVKGEHIFLNYLKISQIESNDDENFVRILLHNISVNDLNDFNDFCENLRNLNLNKLDFVANQLDQLDVDISDYENIKSYLIDIKQNINVFQDLLKKLII